MTTSVARLRELENLLLELERELEAMAGYEEQYPEHYNQLVSSYDAAREEYLQLKSSGDQSYMDEPYACVDELTAEEDTELMSYEAPVCGEGDKVSLVESDWEAGFGESFIIAQGCDAILRTMRTLPGATPAQVPDGFGSTFTLIPGQYTNTKMFVASIDYLYFLVDNKLIRISKEDFARGELLDAMSSGAQNAAWLEGVGKVGFAFLVPFVGAFLGTVGVVAAAATFTVKAGLWYSAHTRQVAAAKSALPVVIANLWYLKKHCPELASLMLRSLRNNALAAAKEADWSAEDYADLLGRLAGGLVNAPSLGLRACLQVALKAYAVSVALRGPGRVAGEVKTEAKQKLLELRSSGVDISDSEADTILLEGCLEKEAIQTRMKEIEVGLQNVSVVIEGAADALRVVE